MKVNSRLDLNQERYLYLLELELTPQVLDSFKGVRFVMMQGSNTRAKEFAKKLARQFLGINPKYFEPKDIAPTSRYQVFRVGNVLSVSHGMGNPSIFTLLHEITKALYFAGSTEVEYIRIGTSGGIGVKPGTVIITEKAYTPNLKPYIELPSLEKNIQVPTIFDLNLAKKIHDMQPRGLPFEVLLGNSIAADDFYLGQGRFDGAIAPQKDLAFRTNYFKEVRDLGIRNFEMESTAMAAFCHEVAIPSTMIAVTLINRLDGDQISSTPLELAEFSDRSQTVAIHYLKNCNNVF